jgi:hypothetical protein
MRQDYKGLGSYGTVGLELVLSIVVGLLVGTWIDKKLGTEPIFSVIWFAFGVAAGARSIWRTWKSMQADAAREEREQGNPTPLFDAAEEKKREDQEAAKNARWRLDDDRAEERGDASPKERAGTEGDGEPVKERHER